RLERLALENIEAGAADPLVAQRLDQSLLIDHFATPDIHQVSVRTHRGNLRPPDHAAGGRGGRQGDSDKVAVAQDCRVAIGAVPARRNPPLGVADTWRAPARV